MKFFDTPLTAFLLSYVFAFAAAKYVLRDDYPLETFFSKFDFFSCGIPTEGCDPTHGYVQYVDQPSAQLEGLISETATSVIIRAESKTVLTSAPAAPGRKSVRIESKRLYNHGLIVLDLAHMPGTVCGTWGSFWTTGTNTMWPTKGEIDIIEGVNKNDFNTMSLHTNIDCVIDGLQSTAQVGSTNCAREQQGSPDPHNEGCGFAEHSKPNTFGEPFNENGGGIYAMEWTSDAIKIWLLAHGSAEGDNALSSLPEPRFWGTASASFQGSGCKIDERFSDQRIIFDLTFCGDWAGNVFGDCAAEVGMDCPHYVAAHPEAFVDQYWDIRGLKVYQQSSGAMTNTPSSVPGHNLAEGEQQPLH